MDVSVSGGCGFGMLARAYDKDGEYIIERTGEELKAQGPYAYQTYITNWLVSVIGNQLLKALEERGFKGALPMDLLRHSWGSGSGSFDIIKNSE